MRAAGGVRQAARRRRQWGACIAIAVLLLQLVVTAGHFHPEDLGFLAGHGAETAITAGADGTGGAGGSQQGAPAHDDCALCFSLYVAGNAAPPDIAPPVLPSTTSDAALPPLEVLHLTSAPYLLFRTRAPPVA